MPTFSHGKNTRVFYAGVNFSDQLREVSVQRTVDTPETTTFGSTAKSYIVGLPDARVDMSGLIAAAGVFEADTQLASILGSATPNWLTVWPNGLSIGSPASALQVHEASYQTQGSVSDVVSFQATFQGTGQFYTSKSLGDYNTTPGISTATTTNGTALDNAAATAGGALCLIQYISLWSGTTDVKFQHSTDGTTWVDLATFTQIPAFNSGVQAISVAAAASTPRRYTRVVITTNAGSGNFFVVPSLARL